MRHGAAFVVKRLAPMIGREQSARRIGVSHNAYTLAEALEYANAYTRRRATLQAMLERDGDKLGWIGREIVELGRVATWIERRGQSATLTKSKRGAGGGAP